MGLYDLVSTKIYGDSKDETAIQVDIAKRNEEMAEENARAIITAAQPFHRLSDPSARSYCDPDRWRFFNPPDPTPCLRHSHRSISADTERHPTPPIPIAGAPAGAHDLSAVLPA